MVIEYVHFLAETCGEMLERMERRPPPTGLDLERLDKIAAGRKRRVVY